MIIFNNLEKLSKWNSRIKVLKFAQRRLASSKINSNVNLQMYTAQQQLTIINTLHNCVINNITRTYLNEKRLQSLKPLFEGTPVPTNLEALLNVSGLGPKLLHKICDSILRDSTTDVSEEGKDRSEDSSKQIQKLRLPAGLVTPSFISQVGVDSVVSIKLGISTISWARLRVGDGQLDSWDLVDISEWAEKKYDVHSIYDLVMDIRGDIPDGDLYVLENSNWSNVANVKKPMKFHIQEAMLTTAICSVFNLIDSGKEPNTAMPNRVYFLRSYTPFRLFSKVIGSERVSAEDIVLNMIAGEADERFRQISFVNGTSDKFLSYNGSMRDSMCQSLLLVVSFAELIMFKNPTGLSMISKPIKKKENKE
ncbi:transcription elongation factor, mitochondrial [Macrosteles quadrilineatus]|uniref:transcription elongation factor, mitochondrial n=1 Tax=Macrosteles quadrilineatus TaxID=74068 RepID=UPI0023E13FE0|nr:transcription elongation factor, mitochondrial [Macrosteles quadrilineatus]